MTLPGDALMPARRAPCGMGDAVVCEKGRHENCLHTRRKKKAS